ncbi:hypothetical protein SETIT_2G218600v2 [Setaria italica]|uniref:Uncharacterized protein n=1 Tax=Setaria italica TaxID=4555 RepID=A0A368Q3P6_SETIT|nr:hypothetical protein SETIT_2G218600v2 [Setaria italica]
MSPHHVGVAVPEPRERAPGPQEQRPEPEPRQDEPPKGEQPADASWPAPPPFSSSSAGWPARKAGRGRTPGTACSKAQDSGGTRSDRTIASCRALTSRIQMRICHPSGLAAGPIKRAGSPFTN